MLGTTIQGKEKKWLWFQIAGLLVLAGIGSLIWKGPQAAYLCSGAGLFFSLVAFGFALRNPLRSPGKGLILIIFLSHGVLIGTAMVLNNLFLTPIPDSTHRLPRIGQSYTDPNGLFTMKGPQDWDFSMRSSAFESGVIIRPAFQGQYMGASEVQVWVKKLDKAPASGVAFIEKMAQSMSYTPRESGQKKAFDFSTEPVQLLSGDKGVISIMDMTRLWIPLRQVTLYGVKDGQYFCSVSATGLKMHSKLNKILLLGLFETIQITDGDEFNNMRQP